MAGQRQSTIKARVPRCFVTIARTRWMESSIDGAARQAHERERRPFTAARQRGRRGGVNSAAPIGLNRWVNKPRSSSHSIACRRTRKRSSARSASHEPNRDRSDEPSKALLQTLGETREQYLERLRESPVHLCRLRFFGDEDRWTMAFYTYSHEAHEPCFFGSGDDHGAPEEALDVAAVYLPDARPSRARRFPRAGPRRW